MSNIAKRSYLYFFVSFIGTGLQNVIPQAFFDAHYASQKEMLLSLCLLLGAAMSIMMTTWWGQLPRFRQWQTNHFKLIIVVTIVILALAMLGLFITTLAVAFIVMFVVTKVLSQYLVNTVDEHYVAVTEAIQLNKHSQQATLFQLIGIVAAPLYFSLLYTRPTLNFAALAVISVMGLYMILSNISAQSLHGDHSRKKMKSADGKLQLSDRLFLFYTVIASSATLIFSANIIFLIQDFYQFDSPVQKGGLILGLVNLAAIVAVALQKGLGVFIVGRANNSTQRAGLKRIHLSMTLISLVLIVFIYMKLFVSMVFLSMISIVLGVVYGLFRLYSREYASHIAQQFNRPRMLLMYNNMSNYSILISAIVMFLLSLLAELISLSFLQLVLWSVIICFALSALIVLRFLKQIK